MVAPFKTNTSQAGTTQTQADQIQWKVVNLDGTHEENMAKIKALTAEDEYVKVVMQTDWAYPVPVVISWGAKMLIWDLNGHCIGAIKSGVVNVWCDILEITDSSAEGNGLIYSSSHGCGTLEFSGRYLILTHGTIKGTINVGSGVLDVIMTGGAIVNWENPFMSTIFNYSGGTWKNNLILPPYVETTTFTPSSTKFNYGLNRNYVTEENTTGAGFSISKSSLVSGAHNYAYGAGWDLAAGDCMLEKLTQKDIPYYLWYRDSNSEPYHLLMCLV